MGPESHKGHPVGYWWNNTLSQFYIINDIDLGEDIGRVNDYSVIIINNGLTKLDKLEF